jgi:hypothetical protein
MSDDEKKKRADFGVGYGKPPKRTQFRKGQSGNAKGRPRGATDTKKSLRKMLNRSTPVKIGEEVKHLSTLELSLERTSEGVRKGDKSSVARTIKYAIDLDRDEEAKGASAPAQQFALEPLTDEEEAIALEYLLRQKELREAF